MVRVVEHTRPQCLRAVGIQTFDVRHASSEHDRIGIDNVDDNAEGSAERVDQMIACPRARATSGCNRPINARVASAGERASWANRMPLAAWA